MILLWLAFLIADLFSIAYPFLAYYLWREWDRYNGTANDAYADRCLYGAIALLLFILLGRFLIKVLLSKHRNGEDEPRMFHAAKQDTLEDLMAPVLTLSITARITAAYHLCTRAECQY
jgi:lipid-A-disaccharide synthase-like uncharacterized protein